MVKIMVTVSQAMNRKIHNIFQHLSRRSFFLQLTVFMGNAIFQKLLGGLTKCTFNFCCNLQLRRQSYVTKRQSPLQLQFTNFYLLKKLNQYIYTICENAMSKN